MAGVVDKLNPLDRRGDTALPLGPHSCNQPGKQDDTIRDQECKKSSHHVIPDRYGAPPYHICRIRVEIRLKVLAQSKVPVSRRISNSFELLLAKHKLVLRSANN
jgi:hypothetical protein